MKPNLVLFGLPNSGKTTVGRLLAAHLGCPFFDTDDLLGASARQLYQTIGEREFRKRERGVVATLKKMQGCVIALGGGTPLDPELGTHILLDEEPSQLWKRMEGIPAYAPSHEQFLSLCSERMARYVPAANRIVDARGKDPHTLAQEIA